LKSVNKVSKTTENVQIVIEYLTNQTPNQKKKRPKKITTLENYLCTHFSKNVSIDGIKQAIELMKKNKNIIVTTNRITYNNI
jgi:3-keto-L-gulonate-6-phosphate decarboxylase